MAFAYSPKIVTEGLVFAVDAANKKSYPGSGTTWTDLAGSNNGTLTNGPTFDSGNGGSIVFDGSDDYISFGNIGSFTSATFSCWVKSNGSQADYTGLLISRPDATGIGINPGHSSDAIWYFWKGDTYGSNSGYLHNSGLTLTTGDGWTMITVTFDSSSGNVEFYKNTTAGTSDTYNVSTVTLSDTRIGEDEGLAGRHLNGNIACFSVYNRALSPSEISQNYNALKSRFGL